MSVEDKMLLHFCNTKEKQLTTYVNLINVHKDEETETEQSESNEELQDEVPNKLSCLFTRDSG